MSRTVSSKSIESRIYKRINSRGRGAVFDASDFLDLGSRQAIDLTLHRLAKRGKIRHLARGIYDFPRKHPVLGDLFPETDVIANALAGRDQTRLQPSGAYAANILGLSEQVPAKIVFLTDGATHTVRIGAVTIQLKRTTPRNMATAGRLSGLLIQAFRHLGKANVTDAHIAQLQRTIPRTKRMELLKDIKFAPVWMHALFRQLAKET